jgi:hypothetical protein
MRFWGAYPDRAGTTKGDKWRALAAFRRHVAGPADEAAILEAVRRYAASPAVRDGFRKNAEGWVPNWREWLSVEPATTTPRTSASAPDATVGSGPELTQEQERESDAALRRERLQLFDAHKAEVEEFLRTSPPSAFPSVEAGKRWGNQFRTIAEMEYGQWRILAESESELLAGSAHA